MPLKTHRAFGGLPILGVLCVGLATALTSLPVTAAEPENESLTVDLVSLEDLAARYVKDVERIEVHYPKQFERLETDWKASSRRYLLEYSKAKGVEQKLGIFARLYNSYHNAHHRPLEVRGFQRPAADNLRLPIRFFGQGTRLSQARFFVSEVAKDLAGIDIAEGDEVLSYDGRPVAEHLHAVLDEVGFESPESHIYWAAREMARQSRCAWGKVHCFREGDMVALRLKDASTGRLKEVQLKWRKPVSGVFAPPLKAPAFPPDPEHADQPAWRFSAVRGTYAPERDDLPDGEVGFLGRLEQGDRRWLVVKIFAFRDSKLVQAAIQEARSPGWAGVILDFGDNGGGNDSAMTLLGGLLGTSFHLERSAIRLTRELQDTELLTDAVFSPVKAAFVRSHLSVANLGRMSPLMPFGCLDESCSGGTEYLRFVDHYERPVVVSAEPVSHVALITGRGTCSKSDSIAALFRATRVGPIVGTPAIGSSGTYYFKKDYVVPLGNKAITVSVTFTPDFSIAGDCQLVQANPPEPDVRVERVFSNRRYYDALTWVEAARALDGWKVPARLDIQCPVDDALAAMRTLGLEPCATSTAAGPPLKGH